MGINTGFIKKNGVIAAFFILSGFVLFWRGIHNGFVFDDSPNIVISLTKNSINGSRYIGFLTFRLNFILGEYRAEGYHILNILLHSVNAFLVYITCRLFFKAPSVMNTGFSPNGSDIAAFTASALFLVHPVNNTTVYMISNRFASLATFFYLLSLLSYLLARLKLYDPKRSVLFLAFSLFFGLCAFRSKEISATLPPVLVLTEVIFFRGRCSRRELFFFMLMFLSILIIPLGEIDLFDSQGNFRGSSSVLGQTQIISRGDYLFTQFRVIAGYYLKSFILPIGLGSQYFRLSHSLLELKTAFSFLALMSLLAIAAWLLEAGSRNGRGRRLLIAYGIIWFFMTLMIDSGVIPIEDISNENRMYLPSIGIFLAAGAAIGLFLDSTPRYRIIFSGLLLCIIPLFAAVSYMRHSDFQSAYTLMCGAYGKNNENPYAALYCGMLLGERRMFRDACGALTVAARSDDEIFLAHLKNRGYEEQLAERLADCKEISGSFR